MSLSVYTLKDIILHSHPEIEISFKFIPKILMSKDCIHFLGHMSRIRILSFARRRANDKE